jgi:hypothetical protein
VIVGPGSGSVASRHAVSPVMIDSRRRFYTLTGPRSPARLQAAARATTGISRISRGAVEALP